MTEKIREIKLYLFVALAFLSVESHSQSLLNSAPLLYNPSFSGMNPSGRYALNLYSPEKNHYTAYNSFDWLSPKLGGGIGVFSGNSVDGKNKFHHQIGLAYAPKFIVKNKIGISPSVMGTFLHHKNNSDAFLTGGILMNTAQFYIGYTFTYITHKKNHAIQIGANKILNDKKQIYLFSDANVRLMKPDFSHHIIQNQYNVGLGLRWALIGCGLYENKYFTALFGIKGRLLSFSYCYRFQQSTNFIGRNEIALRYIFYKKEKNARKTPSNIKLWMLLLKKKK